MNTLTARVFFRVMHDNDGWSVLGAMLCLGGRCTVTEIGDLVVHDHKTVRRGLRALESLNYVSRDGEWWALMGDVRHLPIPLERLRGVMGAVAQLALGDTESIETDCAVTDPARPDCSATDPAIEPTPEPTRERGEAAVTDPARPPKGKISLLDPRGGSINLDLNPQEKFSLLENLRAVGVWPNLLNVLADNLLKRNPSAAHWARHIAGWVSESVQATGKLHSGRVKKNLAEWGECEPGLLPPPELTTFAEMLVWAKGGMHATRAEGGWQSDTDAGVLTEADVEPEPELESELDGVWRRVLSGLRTQVSPVSFESRFSRTRLLSRAADVWVIGAPRQMDCDWLALRAVAHIQFVVRFEFGEEPKFIFQVTP